MLIYIYIYRALAFSLLLAIIGLLSTCISVGISNVSAFAADMPASVYLKPSLTLSIPKSSITLTLDPSSTAFSSDSINIEVGTNNASGYKLYVSTENNSTDLVNTIDNTKTIQTLSTSTPESSFPVNNWGYKLNSGNYLPFTSGALVNSSTGPVNSSATTFTVGAKVDYTKDAGTYQTNLQFNTVPEVAMHYMQDLQDPTLAQRICTTDAPTMVMDKRDEHPCYIRRLADGKCWMVQNLRLGENLATTTGSMTLTSSDSNVGTGGFVLTNKVANGVMPMVEIDDPPAPLAAGYIYDGSAFYCTSDYGCYYNFYTTTIGSGASSNTTRNIDSEYDICPKGWTIPTGGTNTTTDLKSFVAAYTYPQDSTAETIERLLVKPTTDTYNESGNFAPGLTLGGCYSNAGYGINVYSNYWSRTNFSASQGYDFYLNVDSSELTGQRRSNKAYGRPVRCLLQE